MDAPHGNAILFKIFRTLGMGVRFLMENDEMLRMLRTQARFHSKFSGCSGNALHWSAILFRMLRTGAQFYERFSTCSAREGNFMKDFQNAPHGSAILKEEMDRILRMLCTGGQFSSRISGCSARKRDFLEDFQHAPHASAI